MDHNPEVVGSKPTTGIYSFTTSFTETRPMLLCYHCLPSGLDLVKTDHLAARSKLALRLFFYPFLIKSSSHFIKKNVVLHVSTVHIH